MKIKSLLLAAFAVFTTSAFAAPESITTNYLVGVIPAATRTNLAAPFPLDVDQQKDVSVQVDIKAATAVISNLVYYFAPSSDGVTYDTNNLLTWTAVAQGGVGGTNTFVTNLVVNGHYRLFLVGASNGHPTTAITNVMQYNKKKEF